MPIRVALEIAGDRLSLDFTGSAPAAAGPINISEGTAIACVYVAIKHIFPDLPANAGVMRPLDITIPQGSILAAEFPAPTGGYTETILRMIDVIFTAASQAAPERVVANAYGTINALSIAGHRGELKFSGGAGVMFSFYGGDHRRHAGEATGSTTAMRPIFDRQTIPPGGNPGTRPIRSLPAMGAASPTRRRGCHRGGMGAIYEIELLGAEAPRPSSSVNAGAVRPRDVAGGGRGTLNQFSLPAG